MLQARHLFASVHLCRASPNVALTSSFNCAPQNRLRQGAVLFQPTICKPRSTTLRELEYLEEMGITVPDWQTLKAPAPVSVKTNRPINMHSNPMLRGAGGRSVREPGNQDGKGVVDGVRSVEKRRRGNVTLGREAMMKGAHSPGGRGHEACSSHMRLGRSAESILWERLAGAGQGLRCRRCTQPVSDYSTPHLTSASSCPSPPLLPVPTPPCPRRSPPRRRTTATSWVAAAGRPASWRAAASSCCAQSRARPTARGAPTPPGGRVANTSPN
mgnify:CR=1 FL=1